MASTLVFRDFMARIWPSSPSREQETRPAVGPVIEVGDFRIALDSREVKVRGRSVLLTADEFDLLVYMLDHQKRILTPRTRFSHKQSVQKMDALQVLLSLRKKIEPPGSSRHYFHTEPWILYHFDPASRHVRR